MTRKQKSSEDVGDFVPLPPAPLHIVLALNRGERHGYGLMSDVEELSDGVITMGPGTLYGSIKKLRAQGLIEETEGRVDPSTRRPAPSLLPPHGDRTERSAMRRSSAWPTWSNAADQPPRPACSGGRHDRDLGGPAAIRGPDPSIVAHVRAPPGLLYPRSFRQEYGDDMVQAVRRSDHPPSRRPARAGLAPGLRRPGDQRHPPADRTAVRRRRRWCRRLDPRRADRTGRTDPRHGKRGRSPHPASP